MKSTHLHSFDERNAKILFKKLIEIRVYTLFDYIEERIVLYKKSLLFHLQFL